VLFIGLDQAVGAVPGTSTLGKSPLTAGLMLGLNREAAARFSFPVSIRYLTRLRAEVPMILATAGVP